MRNRLNELREEANLPPAVKTNFVSNDDDSIDYDKYSKPYNMEGNISFMNSYINMLSWSNFFYFCAF